MIKSDLATAYRQLRSPNIKTRKHALRVLHDAKRRQQPMQLAKR
ncbi:putative metal homeostasis protein [Lacticaseibacillus baoqingensis]|uniref:Metal homeostasis protein n=1 Tax=Lacticaseibacillus baoqingensis TaxID=2486013 RepID=A0ABW4E7J3_9LACO|nr:putative metal homeostasis protein [Lacticaseibacillus baoqingensis]